MSKGSQAWRWRNYPSVTNPSDIKELIACQKEILQLKSQARSEVTKLVMPAFMNVETRIRTRRNAAIRRLPGFWHRALMNHPRLAALVAPHERHALRYLYNMDVVESPDVVSGYRVFLHFRKNPYFTNQCLLKEFVSKEYADKNRLALVSPITWRPGQNFLKLFKKDTQPSFFRWFSQRRNVTLDKAATALCKDLWERPLTYYLRQNDAMYSLPSSTDSTVPLDTDTG